MDESTLLWVGSMAQLAEQVKSNGLHAAVKSRIQEPCLGGSSCSLVAIWLADTLPGSYRRLLVLHVNGSGSRVNSSH